MHDPIDLLIPKSTEALLAEEWSIDPYTPLPSFLEMKLIEDATRSGREAFQVAYNMLLQKLSTSIHSNTHGTQDDWGIIYHCKRWATAFISVLKRYHMEGRFLLLYLLERHCLRISSATLAESIYGGKRAMVMNDDDGRNDRKRVVPLDRKNATRLALLLTLSPYLKEKLGLLLQSQPVLGIDPTSLRESHRKILIYALQCLRLGTEATNFFCQWRFLIGRSLHFDPISLCLGTVVRRKTQEDLLQQNRKDDVHVQPRLSSTLRTAAWTIVSLALSVSWLTQMRVIWLEREALRRRSDSDSNLPPPPHHKVKVSSQTRRQCPKCHETWVEPVVVIPGDFLVYCRGCVDPEILASKKVVRLL